MDKLILSHLTDDLRKKEIQVDSGFLTVEKAIKYREAITSILQSLDVDSFQRGEDLKNLLELQSKIDCELSIFLRNNEFNHK